MPAEDDNDLGVMLTRQLTAIEGSLKDLETFTAGVDGRNLPSSSELEARDQLLNEVWQQASAVLLKLEGITGTSQRRAPMMQIFIKVKTEFIRLKKLADKEENRRSGNEPAAGANAVDQSMIAAGATKSANLPRIELPKFSGSPTEWLSFKGRFEKRIATITEDAEKYVFLQKGLEGFEPAYNACKAFEDSELSFDDAWIKLEERFYKKRIAFEGHFQKVLKIKRPQKQNAKALLNIVDAVDTMMTSTRQIAGEAPASMKCIANGLLICLVKERIDEQTLAKLEDKLDLQTIYNWDEFKKELERIANQLCCNVSTEHPKHPYNKVVALAANPAHKKPAQAEIKCSMCEKAGHFIYRCDTFLNQPVPARLEMVKQSQHCYNCLQKGHGIKACKNTGRCKECKGRHHTLLHETRGEKQTSTPPSSKPTKEPEAGPSQTK